MKTRYSRAQLIKIVEQAQLYQCACPAQLCKAIGQIRELHAYQRDCLTQTDTDREVHERIALSCEKNHAELERCLEDVLKLEGWNLATLDMPPGLDKLPRA